MLQSFDSISLIMDPHITNAIELAKALKAINLGDIMINNINASLNKRSYTIKPEGYEAIYRDIEKSRPTEGTPEGIVLTSVLAGAQTQNALNAFNVGTNARTEPDKRSIVAKTLDCSFPPRELYVEIPLRHLDSEKLRVLAGSLYRPKLTHFINSLTATTGETSMSMVLEFNPGELFRYRLHPANIVAAIYRLPDVTHVLWDDNTMSCTVLYKYALEPTFEQWSSVDYMAMFDFFRVTKTKEIHDIHICMIREALGVHVDIYKMSITLYGPVYKTVVKSKYLRQIIGGDPIRMLKTNDVISYGKLRGALAAENLHISLLTELVGKALLPCIVLVVRSMYIDGYYLKNNDTNILKASHNFLDSVLDRGLEDKYMKFLYGGTLSNVDTIATYLMTGGLPALGTATSKIRLHTPAPQRLRNITTSMFFKQDVDSYPPNIIVSNREFSVRLEDIIAPNTVLIKKLAPYETISLQTKITIVCTAYQYTMNLDVRTPRDSMVHKIVLQKYGLPLGKSDIRLDIYNASDRHVTVDYSRVTLIITSPQETLWDITGFNERAIIGV